MIEIVLERLVAVAVVEFMVFTPSYITRPDSGFKHDGHKNAMCMLIHHWRETVQDPILHISNEKIKFNYMLLKLMCAQKYEINIRPFAFKLHLHHYNEKYFIMHNMYRSKCMYMKIHLSANNVSLFFFIYIYYYYSSVFKKDEILFYVIFLL